MQMDSERNCLANAPKPSSAARLRQAGLNFPE